MSYSVGDILWVVHKDRPGLMAYQVIEEITKKTLQGAQTQYIIKSPNPKAKAISLSSIKGDVYHTAEEAQTVLLENATRAIDTMIEKTQLLVNRAFLKVETPLEKVVKSIDEPTDDQKLPYGYQWVEMEDGTKVKMKIPENLL